MGLDLGIYPTSEGYDDVILCHTKIEFDRERELFTKIIALPFETIPKKTRCCGYFGDKYGEVTENPYGQRIQYTEARYFKDLKANSKWNQAILKFLETINPITIVVLYWH